MTTGGGLGGAGRGKKKRMGPSGPATPCHYRRQLKFPDTVEIGARISRIGRSSLTMEHRLVSESLRAVAAEGDSTLVTFDYLAQKSASLPEHLRARIEQLAGKSFPAPPAP